MALKLLKIQQVRNIRQAQLPDLELVNVFHGKNGAGKTSVLEAIHLLGMGRTFRGSSIRSLITHKEADCTVFGEVVHDLQVGAAPLGTSIGVQRARNGEAQVKVGGRSVRGLSELVEQFPLQVISAASFDLLTGAPGGRRQYMDWGVFHVEQRFYLQWKRFQRCIKQRNNLLRRGKIDEQELSVWTRDLVEAGEAISDYRESYFRLLAPKFIAIMRELAPSLDALELRYRRGWDKALTYAESLEQGKPADLEQGYTHSGPQRADLRLGIGGHLASETLSRGQQKLVVCGLKLAQGQLMAQAGRQKCTYLIDDLPSELDKQHSELVCGQLASMNAQVFISCVQRSDLEAVWPSSSDMALFHVEQGKIEKNCS